MLHQNIESWVSGLNQQFAKLSYVLKRTGGSNPPLSTSKNPSCLNSDGWGFCFLIGFTAITLKNSLGRFESIKNEMGLWSRIRSRPIQMKFLKVLFL